MNRLSRAGLNLGILAAAGLARASFAADPVLTTNAPASEASAPVNYQPFTIGAELGLLNGFGGAVRWRFADHFGVRVGADYFNYSLNNAYSGISYKADLRLQSEPVTLDLFPWKNHSFYVSLGVGFNQSQLTGSAVAAGNEQIGGNVYTPAQIGTLNLAIKPQVVTPYLSIGGNLYFDRAKHFSLGAELGAMYEGKMDVSLTDSNGGVTPADLASYKSTIQHDANYARVLPVLKLSLNYSF